MHLRLRQKYNRKRTDGKTAFIGKQPHEEERRYLQGVTYMLPKDLPEQKRLDFQHYLLYAVLGTHAAAPIEKQIRHILDVATGTGRWAHETARTFPNAQVIGLDMEEPVNPIEGPNNYTFLQGNLFAGLLFPDQTFEYVHQRFLVLALPAKQWPFVISELVRVTRPGGFIELVEGGGNFLQIGPATTQLKQWWDVASRVHGIDVSLMAQLPLFLRNGGLHAIRYQTYRVPVGEAGGRVGKMLQQDILASLPGLKSFICKNASVSPEHFDRLVTALPNEWKALKTCYDYSLAYGQKREGGADE
jgi:SAM-dependent methyltransferase